MESPLSSPVLLANIRVRQYSSLCYNLVIPCDELLTSLSILHWLYGTVLEVGYRGSPLSRLLSPFRPTMIEGQAVLI